MGLKNPNVSPSLSLSLSLSHVSLHRQREACWQEWNQSDDHEDKEPDALIKGTTANDGFIRPIFKSLVNESLKEYRFGCA